MQKFSKMSIRILISIALISNSVVSDFSFFSYPQPCGKNEFSCSNGSCINSTKHCDGVTDCGDGSDETDCAKCSTPEFYKCANNKCILRALVCDKNNDCEDGSDENNCHNRSPVKPCSSDGEFECTNGSCIPTFWHCDGTVDCDDGSDEDAEKCREKMSCREGYLCKNLHCISKMWRCDGRDDCGDGSDETHCDIRLIEPEQCKIADRKFLCHDLKKCISVDNVCNNNNDCLDASDEGGLCNNITDYKQLCKETNCSGVLECLKKPHGVMCVCPKGTHFLNNTCLDINECEEFGICDQFCFNSYGKYECSCDSNYELVDNHKCKIKGDDPVLVYSSLRQIKVLNLVTHNNYGLVDKLQQATGLAVDGLNVYWTIIYEGIQAIVRANKNDTKPEIIVTSGLGTPENLAIDSITHNLYFTDAKMKHIGVCNNDGSVCTVLHNKNLDKPRAIAVSPMDGFMYWTDWGESPLIARSGMDGSLPQKFITQDIHWPNGIHVDYLGQRIYWVDAKIQLIESVKLDASDRRVIVTQSVDHPFSLIVFEDKLYWSDWSGREIRTCNKFTGKDRKSLVRESKSRIYGMQIFHPSLFKTRKLNPCEKAKCSDICLLAPKKDSIGYTCACPDDKQLSPEGLFCYDKTINPSLIVGTSTSILEIEHVHLGRHKVKEIPLKTKISRISAVTYNSLTGNIIIYDSKSKKLFMYDLTKMKLSDLVTSEIVSLYSLKFDSHGNNLYWCDWTKRTLEVLSLSTITRSTILNEFDGRVPIAVALVPDKGYMFVAMKDGFHIHIDRINMDGSITSLVHIVEFGLTANSIVLYFDMITRRLYFTDLKNGIIDSVSEDGFDRKLIKSSGFVIDIVSMNNEIFWVSQGSKTLNWMDKNSNDQSSRTLDLENWKSDSNLCLTIANDIDKDIQHPCQRNNGGCSHLCLLSAQEKVCSCPFGMILSKNSLECIPLKECKSDEYRCSTGECILSRFRCDSKQDCPRGDDEDVVKCLNYAPNLCPKAQFLCHDKTKCLDNKFLCNNFKDCSDGSDEKNCSPKHICDPVSEFLCSTGECIQQSFLCDGNIDCMNGQDELNCQNHTCHHMEFRCKSGTCIAAAWECDGEMDCVDGSDEHNTCITKKCKADQFSCGNGRCISHKFTCNGEDDCGDNSDEIGCLSKHAYMTKPIKLCNEEKEFECENIHGHCVPIEARCNSTSECKHFEDELNCGCQKNDFFECNNKRCIPKEWLCDKTDDCGDQSDESYKLCDSILQYSSILIVSADDCDGYLCKNKECIPLDRVCNHKLDCKDGSDEGDLCGLSCQFMNCSHTCQETPKGGKCICSHGYKIAQDGKTCKDIDECKDENECAQFCKNLDGSFSCSCLNSDYILRADKSSCKALGPTMDIIYSDANQIRSTTGDLKESKFLFSKQKIQVSDLDIDIRRNLIYWTSEEAGTLICMDMQQKHKIYMKDLVNPTLVRIDWLTENIYFIENHCNIIVCNLNIKHCATIYRANVHTKIKSFAIDPLSGLMFWTESIWTIWNSPTTIIRRSDTSGYNVKTIVDQGLHDITDLTVDSIKRVVYWVDMVNSTIERANYDGSSRIILIFTNHLPKKLSLYEDKLFWTNDGTGYSIFKCKILGTVDIHCETVPIQVFAPIEIFMISQQAKQINASNICSNVHCTFICTSGSKGPMCVCQDGSQVEPGAICEDAGHRKLPTFKDLNNSGNRISFYIALFIVIVSLLMMIYYYLYHYKKKPFVLLPGFHFHNPLSTISEVMDKRENIQHVQLEPGHHSYENPMNVEKIIKNHVGNEVILNYNDSQSVYVSGESSRRTSLSISEYEENQKKKLIVL